MRVLSDGARRLINEMKKLRLSLIFNEQARASASADTMAVGPQVRRRRASKYHLPESRRGRAFTCTRFGPQEPRASKKFRPYPWIPAVFSPWGSLLQSRQVRARAAAATGSFFWPSWNISNWRSFARRALFRFFSYLPALAFAPNE